MLLIFILTLVSYNRGNNVENKNDKNKLNLENVYTVLLKENIQYPLIVLAQVYHESANLTSTACLKRNNLLGFQSGKMYFKSWQECIAYAKKWQDKRYISGDYYKFLKKIGYAQDINYNKKVKVILAKIITMDFIIETALINIQDSIE